MNDSLITISSGNVSVNEAIGSQILFSTQFPFDKLDTQNSVSFQLITIFFNDEPPNPDGSVSTYQRTLVYSFPHGYTYVPSTWFLATTNNFTTVIGPEGATLAQNSISPFFSAAQFVATVDDTNVNFYIDKYFISGPFPVPTIIGTFLSIRSYVFVDDLSGTDVPPQPQPGQP